MMYEYDLSKPLECDRCVDLGIECHHKPYDWCNN